LKTRVATLINCGVPQFTSFRYALVPVQELEPKVSGWFAPPTSSLHLEASL